MRLAKTALPVAVLCLLLPISPAEAQPGGGLSADRIELVSAGLLGPATGLEAFPDGPLTFDLTATRLEGVVDTSEKPLVVNGAGVAPADERSEQVAIDHVQRSSATPHADARLVVLALPGSTIEWNATSSILKVEQSPDRSYTPAASASRAHFSLPTQGTLQIPFREGTALLRGDFRLVFTNIDITFSSLNGSLEVATAYEATPVASPAPAMRTVSKEAYLDVTAGTLRFGVKDAVAFLSSATATPGHGVVRLLQATGTVVLPGGPVDLGKQDLALEGPVDVSFVARTDGRLAAGLQGEPTAATIDGQAIRIALPERGADDRWILLVAATFLVVASALALHRRTGAVRMRRLHATVADERFEEAARRATLLARWHPRHRDDANIARAISLIRLERPDEARRILEGASFRPMNRPGQKFLLARLAAQRGDREAAIKLLVDCLASSPTYRADALADPLLSPIVEAAVRMSEAQPGGYA